jgi:hypothetical protein
MTTMLRALVAEELNAPVDPRVSAMAAAIAAKHGAASRAVLFYGSCLREKQLDGLMLDFYLIVSDYRSAYRKRWLAAANRLIPPNVFYFEQGGLRSKYAVLSEADFARECSPEAWTVSTAARFAQPSRLAWSADGDAGRHVAATVARAAPTLIRWTLPLQPDASPTELWECIFSQTFSAELRAERRERSAAIVAADPDRYRRITRAAMQEIGSISLGRTADAGAGRWWRRMQRRGKIYSVLRLAKASLTFAGGAEYIAWKINRHAGTDIQLTPWQRRHPLLTAIRYLPRLMRTGAVR